MTDHTPGPGGPSGGGVRKDRGVEIFHTFAHARRTGWGPLLKLGLFSVCVTAVLSTVMALAIEPMFDVPATADTDPDPSSYVPAYARALWGTMLWFLAMWVIYAVVDGALLRWMFGRSARLRLGVLELQLMLIALLFSVAGCFSVSVLLVVSMALAGLAMQAQSFPLFVLALAFTVAGTLGLAYAAARLSPAAALTVHDRGLRVFSGWRATRGAAWPMLGAFAVVWLIYISLSIWIYGGVMAAMYFAIGASALANGAPDFGASLAEMVLYPPIAVDVAFSIAGACIGFAIQAQLAGVNARRIKQVFGERA